ncbi:MAG TPA: hypothetical protein VM580_32165 [Labilithrix sp.]|jgi:hypothetical protein|nr:hypothetical protein [Labilithrix sp.]
MFTRPLVILGALLLTSCLEGDPNPFADAGTSGDASSGGPSSVPTGQPSSVCSQQSAQAVNLPFRNEFSDRTVRLYWVNYQCQEVAYGAVKPKTTYVQQTYVGHPWRVRDASTNALYKEFIPTTTAPPEVTVP